MMRTLVQNFIVAILCGFSLGIYECQAIAQDITRIHGYVSRAESGYTSEEDAEEASQKSLRLYKIINQNRDSQEVNLEEAGNKDGTPKQYTPIIQGSLNQFYQTTKSSEQLTLTTQKQSFEQAQAIVNKQASPQLKHYVSVTLGRPFSQTMTLTSDTTTQSFSGQNQIYQGLAAIYFGRVLDVLPFMRFEYGGQYEVLSFTEETTSQYNSIRNHNGTASIRTFVDIPLFPNLALSLGAEGGIGLFQQFYNTTAIRTFSTSYAALGGLTFVLSNTKSFYLMGRYGVIPSVKLNFSDGTTKNASLNSFGILAGMQFFI